MILHAVDFTDECGYTCENQEMQSKFFFSSKYEI